MELISVFSFVNGNTRLIKLKIELYKFKKLRNKAIKNLGGIENRSLEGVKRINDEMKRIENNRKSKIRKALFGVLISIIASIIAALILSIC